MFCKGETSNHYRFNVSKSVTRGAQKVALGIPTISS